MKWLVLENASAAQVRSEELSSEMGYPHPESKTSKATECIEHPSNSKAALLIGPSVWSWSKASLVDMETLLSATEREALYSADEMQSGGWFPTPVP